DRAVRTTKKSEDAIDAVVILALLKNNHDGDEGDQIVCVKQFRPPLDAFTLELPAGLIDSDEEPAEAAIREFREETGYLGTVSGVLPASYLSPGLTNESACLVRLEVDLALEHNRKIHNNQVKNDSLEGCEADRGLEKILLPRKGLLRALHKHEEQGTKVFAALYSFALGMEIGEASSLSKATSNFPIVQLELDSDGNPAPETSLAVTSALRDCGFLLVKQICSRWSCSVGLFVRVDDLVKYTTEKDILKPLTEWYCALRKTKAVLLRCIAVGLELDDPDFFCKLHSADNDALRLLTYPPTQHRGNRCKEHSDYGTITLLLNDGVSGLEAFVNDQWLPIPYVEGHVVVNVGSLLSDWTGQQLKATLHRVAGPASVGSQIGKKNWKRAYQSLGRQWPISLIQMKMFQPLYSAKMASIKKMSVAQYIHFRSGGKGRDRTGIALTSTEESRLGT
ncbi:hypothetical protein THAOC_35426, partial [Thalassiosira oceanica]